MPCVCHSWFTWALVLHAPALVYLEGYLGRESFSIDGVLRPLQILDAIVELGLRQLVPVGERPSRHVHRGLSFL